MDDNKTLENIAEYLEQITQILSAGSVEGIKSLLTQEVPQIQRYCLKPDRTWGDYYENMVHPGFSFLAPRTASEYEYYYDHWLRSKIHTKYMQRTEWRDVQNIVDDLPSFSVQRHCCRLWSKIANLAIKDNYLWLNPVSGISFKDSNERKKQSLSASEVVDYIESLKGTRYFRSALCGIGAGLRPEEMIPLLASDIKRIGDYTVIDINKSLTQYNQEVWLGKTKTKKSKRKSYLAGVLGEWLWEDVQNLETRQLFPARNIQGEDLNEKWFPRPRVVSQQWRLWCERHDKKYIRLGDMRSIYSNLHYEINSNNDLVQISMGHIPSSVRGRHYLADPESALKMLAINLANYIEKSKENVHSAT